MSYRIQAGRVLIREAMRQVGKAPRWALSRNTRGYRSEARGHRVMDLNAEQFKHRRLPPEAERLGNWLAAEASAAVPLVT